MNTGIIMNIVASLSGILTFLAGVFAARRLEHLKFKQTICKSNLESIFKFFDEEINRHNIVYYSILNRKPCDSLSVVTVDASTAKTNLIALTDDETIKEEFEQFTRIVFYLNTLRDGKTHHKGKDAFQLTNEGRELAGLLKRKLTKVASL